MKLKNLYLTAIIKWRWVEVLFKKGVDLIAFEIAAEVCRFCLNSTMPNDISPSSQGDTPCGRYCQIDKKICGSPNSLVARFFNAELCDTSDYAENITRALIDKYHELKQK